MIRKLLLSAICFSLSACVGYMSFGNGDKEYQNGQFGLGGKGFVNEYKPETLTADQLIEVWGQPDKKYSDNDFEIWRYNKSGLAWAGIMPVIVIIPIPLLVPTGKHYTNFKVQNNVILSATENIRTGSLAFCGFFPFDVEPIVRFGCFSG